MTNNKTGLSYFTIDTDRYQDRRIKRLKKDVGCQGLAVYDFILCEIYRVRGYYLEWDDNTCFDIAEYFGLQEECVHDIVRYCGRVGLFNDELLQKGIITSFSIQRRYSDMCMRAKRKIVMLKYLLTKEQPDDTEIVNTDTNVDYNTGLDEEIELLKKDEQWHDQLHTLYSLTSTQTKRMLDDFAVQCAANGKNGHNSLQDAKQHFNSWLRKMKQKKDKDKDKDDTTKQRHSSQRRSNLLKVDEQKDYGNSF